MRRFAGDFAGGDCRFYVVLVSPGMQAGAGATVA
jgi:hypothetical protein